MSHELSDRIHDALDAANIFHEITEKDFGLLPNLAQSAEFVWIDSRDRASSRSVIEKILVDSDLTEKEAELTPPDSGRMNPFGLGRKAYKPPERRDAPFESASTIGSDAPGEPVPADTVEDFDPDDATAEVWSGTAQGMADNLKMCLRENGIGCVISEANGRKSVCVLPSAEKRAREIVREVVEATPPE